MSSARLRASEGGVPKKNGLYHVALLVGGPADIFREQAAKLGSKRGIDVRHHWDWDKSRMVLRPVPRDVDVVFCLVDMLSHAAFGVARQAAKAAGVPCMLLSRKESASSQTFRAWGFPGVRGSGDPGLLAPLKAREAARHKPEAKVLPMVQPEPTPEPAPTVAAPEVQVVAEPLEVQVPEVRLTLEPLALPASTAVRGVARPETMALVARVQAMALADGVSILVSGRELRVDPLEGKP